MSTPARVLIAPDSFKGTASAVQVAEAIGRGWRTQRPQDLLTLIPMADGGEGTLDTFAAAVPGAAVRPVTVTGPDNRPVASHWLLLPDGTGVVELAATSGITLLDRLRPLTAHSRGFGQAIAAALRHGVQRLVLGIGGSASTDGGAGMLAELGARFLDADGVPVPDGGAGLGRLESVDLSGLPPLPVGGVTVLTDVTSPLLGPGGAAAVYGPQKGADLEGIAVLEAGLGRLATVSGPDTSPTAAVSGAGAAGGVGFALALWGAMLVPGAAAVSELLGLPELVGDSDLVITGEGRFDHQSGLGKVPGHLLELAGRLPVALVAGDITGSTERFVDALALRELAGSVAAAMDEPLPHLESAGRQLAQAFSRRRQLSAG